jgi:dihydroxyacetone kinase-like protein
MMETGFIKNLLNAISAIMAQKRDYLIELDSVVGDGDLGLTMSDGFAAAAKAAADSGETDIGKLLYFAGKAMSSAVPSTMGTLMASGLMNAGKVLKGETSLDPGKIVLLFSSYADGVASRGGAKPGEKTFLDGILPAVDALKSSLDGGASLDEAAGLAVKAAEEGYEHTHGMLAKHGRAAARGEASRELKDPGAQVAVFIMQGLADAIKEQGK